MSEENNYKEKSKNEIKKEKKKIEKEKKITELKSKKKINEKNNTINYDKDDDDDHNFKNKKWGEINNENYKEIIKNRLVKEWSNISDLNESCIGKYVLIRARVSNIRSFGNSLCFLQLRDGLSSIQAVISKNDENYSKSIIHFINSTITKESIIDIEAIITNSSTPIESCVIKNLELKIYSLFLQSKPNSPLPLQFDDLSKPTTYENYDDNGYNYVIPLYSRLNNRCLDLRTFYNLSIFKIQSAISNLFRDQLLINDFIEIHSPKIIKESINENSFKLNYFNEIAYLSESTQFYRQLAIVSDFKRVFEIGPVYKPDLGHTHRHLNEFTSLDFEMTFKDHYHEVLDLLDNLMISIFKILETNYQNELKIINNYQLQFEKFKFSNKTPRFTFSQVKLMLIEFSENENNKNQLFYNSPTCMELNVQDERIFGKIVKEKFNVDYYIIEKPSTEYQPFYIMPDSNNEKILNSFHIYINGEKIGSGSQRIHDWKLLEKRYKNYYINDNNNNKNNNNNNIENYINIFKFGCEQHAGCSIGLERLVMAYLGLGNIRKASFCPRDPTRLTP
ncbi:hypothetical protein ACTFIW_011560 [Dictyostelium discoideum]